MEEKVGRQAAARWEVAVSQKVVGQQARSAMAQRRRWRRACRQGHRQRRYHSVTRFLHLVRHGHVTVAHRHCPAAANVTGGRTRHVLLLPDTVRLTGPPAGGGVGGVVVVCAWRAGQRAGEAEVGEARHQETCHPGQKACCHHTTIGCHRPFHQPRTRLGPGCCHYFCL